MTLQLRPLHIDLPVQATLAAPVIPTLKPPTPPEVKASHDVNTLFQRLEILSCNLLEPLKEAKQQEQGLREKMQCYINQVL